MMKSNECVCMGIFYTTGETNLNDPSKVTDFREMPNIENKMLSSKASR